MPQLYSSGGETRTTSNQLESAQSTDLSGLVGVLKSFNATFGEIARKSTVASLTDTAKVNQTNKILMGDKTLAETPNLLSSEFTAAYEETSKNILVRDLQNDIRDLGAQAEKSNWVNPDGLQQAMHSGYSEMRAKIATNPKLAALILPDLDTQFAEEYQSRRYTVTARRVGQDVEKARYDTKRQADKIDEDMQDTLSNVAYHNAGKVDFSAILEKGVEDVATEYRKIYGGNSFYGEAETAKIIDEKQDKFADKMMHSAIKGFLAKGDLIGLRKFVAEVDEGQFFKNNRTLSDGLWKRSAGRAKIRTDLKYFITQLESEAMNAKDPSDLLARIQGSEALKGNTFADDLDVMRGQDNETTWQAIKSLYAVASVYNKGNGESEQDQFQTLAFTFIANEMLATGQIAKVDALYSQLSSGNETMKFTDPDAEGNVTLSLGDMEVFKIPEPKKDAKGNYIINTAQEALYEQAKENPTPVMKQKILNALGARIDKYEKSMSRSLKDNGNLINMVEEESKDAPIMVGDNFGAGVKDLAVRNVSSAVGIHGDSLPAAMSSPLGKKTGAEISGQFDGLHQAGDYPNLVKSYRQINTAANELGIPAEGMYRNVDKKWRYAAPVVGALSNEKADELLSLVPKGSFNQMSDPIMGQVAPGAIVTMMNNQYGAELRAMSGGDAEVYNGIIQNVLMPALSKVTRTYVATGKDIDYEKIVNSLISDESSQLYKIMKSIPEKNIVPINPSRPELGTTLDPRWREAGAAVAIKAASKGVGYNGTRSIAVSYPVIVAGEEGRRFVRLATRPNGVSYLTNKDNTPYEVEIR